jgi:ketopantoate reductase PanE/ApbA-like protein
MQLCVAGAGAIGGFMREQLALAGHDVALVTQGDHLSAIQSEGLQIVGTDGRHDRAQGMAQLPFESVNLPPHRAPSHSAGESAANPSVNRLSSLSGGAYRAVTLPPVRLLTAFVPHRNSSSLPLVHGTRGQSRGRKATGSRLLRDPSADATKDPRLKSRMRITGHVDHPPLFAGLEP